MSEFNLVELLQECRPKIEVFKDYAYENDLMGEYRDYCNLISRIDLALANFDAGLPKPPEESIPLCDGCKHEDLSASRYPCNICSGLSGNINKFEPK